MLRQIEDTEGIQQRNTMDNVNLTVSSGINDFSCDVVSTLITSELNGVHSNHFVSPFSLSVALMMLTLGSANNTYRQLVDGMKMNQLEEENNNLAIHESYSKFLEAVRKNPYIVVDNIGIFDKNRVAIQSQYDSYKSNIEKYYNASVESVDFAREGKAIQDMVNERMNSSTHGMIPHFMTTEPNRDTVGLLLNAVYFEGKWEIPFVEEKTSDKVFHTSNGQEKTVPFMNSYKTYYATKEVNASGQPSRIVRLPYENDTSMVILLPNKKDGLSYIIKDKDSLKEALTTVLETVNADNNGFQRHDLSKVNLQLPKFSIKNKMKLKSVLESIGMTDMFKEGIADLIGIAPNGRLFVSDVNQEAVVEVDEQGTKASAVTSIEIQTRSFVPVIDFKVDHPFLFMIRDDKTSTILFVGVVNTIE